MYFLDKDGTTKVYIPVHPWSVDRTLRFHNVSQDGNVHIQYSVIISKKKVKPSINHKLKAFFQAAFTTSKWNV